MTSGRKRNPPGDEIQYIADLSIVAYPGFPESVSKEENPVEMSFRTEPFGDAQDKLREGRNLLNSPNLYRTKISLPINRDSK